MDPRFAFLEVMADGFVPYAVGKAGRGPGNPMYGKPGSYVLLHFATGKIYVGYTGNLARRTSENSNSLKHGRHKNRPLQEAYNVAQSHMFFVKPTDSLEEAQQLEQATIDLFKDQGTLFNIAVDNALLTRLGRTLTPEHIEILRQSNTNRIVSEESRQKMRDAHLGRVLDADMRKKLSDIHLERLSTPEGKESKRLAIEKISKAVIVDGTVYVSIADAARQIGCVPDTLKRRIKSTHPKFSGYYFKEQS